MLKNFTGVSSGHVAYRNGKAWFVEDFCTVLGEKIHRRQPTDITDIYNEVSFKIVFSYDKL